MATTVMIAVGMMGGLGLLVGVGLALASKIFYVYVDPLIVEIEGALPGANCGGCGYPGCGANAEAIVAGNSRPDSCVAAGPELALEIAAIMGVTIEAKEPDIARPGCTYGTDDADTKFRYSGINDCRAAVMLNGGMKICTIGCLGLGTCMKACPFGAISMGSNGLPVVNEKACTGCGTCERVCPKNIITLSSVTRRILHEYTREDCTTPCQRACPAGIDVCEYIRRISLGNYEGAVAIIRERNPFPSVIGRICPRPCENECRRQYVDEPVAINYLKRFAGDYERSMGKRVLPLRAPDTGRRIAIIGGGVEGLSTAFFLSRLGHRVTVFESTGKMGGLLRTAISVHRLPPAILDWDIEGLLEMGVAVGTGKTFGEDFTLNSLLSSGYQSVFLATGGWDSRMTRGKTGKDNLDRSLPQTFLLIDVVRNGWETIKGPVVMVGGAGLACQTALRMAKAGIGPITLIFREAEEDLPEDTEEIRRLHAETITVIPEAGVVSLVGEGNDLVEIEICDIRTMERRRIPSGMMVLASGRFPEMVFSPVDGGGKENAPDGKSVRWEGFPPYKSPFFKDEVGIFSKADPVTDFSGAIRAIGAGRRAAASIHKKMYGIPLDHSPLVLTADSVIQNVDEVERVSKNRRTIMPLAGERELAEGMEIEKGFSREMALSESARCLQCGLICYKKTAN